MKQLKDRWFDRMESISLSPLTPRKTDIANKYLNSLLYRYFKIPDLFVDSIRLSFDELYRAIELSVEALLELRAEVWTDGIVSRPDTTEKG